MLITDLTHDHWCSWDYLGYLSALQLGDPDEYTGLESYVCDLVFTQNSSAYLPVGKCTASSMEVSSADVKPANDNQVINNLV